MVSAPPSPPSPVHCAQPVAMVTGLSDRWLSLRHGVLNGPAASRAPALFASRARHTSSAAGSKLDKKLEAGYHLPVNRSNPDPPGMRSLLKRCGSTSRSWSSGAGCSPLKRHRVLSTSLHELCSSVTSSWLMQRACP